LPLNEDLIYVESGCQHVLT